VIAALICGGETWKLAAICGKDVEMMDESNPSMKNATATTVAAILDAFVREGGRSTGVESITIQSDIAQGAFGAGLMLARSGARGKPEPLSTGARACRRPVERRKMSHLP